MKTDVAVNSSPPSIRKAFDFAWMTYRQQFGLFTALVLTFFASWVILEIIVVAGQRLGILLWLLAHLIFFIIFAGMEIGFIRICLASYDGKEIRFTDIFSGLQLGINFLLAQLINTVITIVGFLLLVIPGAYLSAKYAFYAFHFAEASPTLIQSFQQSAIITQRSMLFVVWFSFLILVINILGASILGVGLIATVPLSVLMKASIYRQMQVNQQ